MPVLDPAGVVGVFVVETGPASGACVVLLAEPAAFPAVESDWAFTGPSSGSLTGLFVPRPAEGVLNCLSRSIVSTRRAFRSAGSSRIVGLPSSSEALDAPGDPGIRPLTADVLEGTRLSVFSFRRPCATWRCLRSATSAPAPVETSPRPLEQAAVRAVAAIALPDRVTIKIIPSTKSGTIAPESVREFLIDALGRGIMCSRENAKEVPCASPSIAARSILDPGIARFSFSELGTQAAASTSLSGGRYLSPPGAERQGETPAVGPHSDEQGKITAMIDS